MKVRASVKRICDKCKIVRRQGVVRVICANQSTSSERGVNFQLRVSSASGLGES